MASVGVRELKEHTSEILRRVEDDGESIAVTRRGKVIATLIPGEPGRSEASIQRVQARLEAMRRAIATEIGETPVDAVALARDQRRDFTPEDALTSDRQHGR